jgi:hypothetical protein
VSSSSRALKRRVAEPIPANRTSGRHMATPG